jgi:2'-5' RNA ligase
LRDRKLREFWPTEPIIASAIQTIVAARANMSWSLDGPPRTVGIIQRMMQSANLGKGWLDLQIKVCTDLLTQDNGAFVEIVRQEDAPNSPVLNLAHLDAGRCIRTGIPETPVIYYDRHGVEHKLAWYQVLTFEDMPSPIEEMNGLQVCFLSRVLRAAQIIKDFGIYKREKIAGRNPGEIHFVSGVQTKLINDKLQDDQHTADNQGYSRFMLPTIIGSLDPNSTVSTASIDLRSVPDGFDEDTTLRWYIAQIAMAAGADYQEFAPLSTGTLGTSSQSEVLDRKSRGKGQETWRKLWEHKLNFNGIMPQSVTFAFDEKDIESDLRQADLGDKQAKIFSTYYDKGQGVLPLNVIHQMMADEGILKPEYMALLNTTDVTPDIVATDDIQAPTESELEEAADTPSINIAESQPANVPMEVRSKDSAGDINYGCLMLMMPVSIRSLAMQIAAQINPDDLFEPGDNWSSTAIVDDTHVTVKYGFLDSVTPEQITPQIQGLLPLTVKIGDLSLFQNDDFDVLKLNVDGAELRQMNAIVSRLPNEDSHPVYNPHMTIAYLKPGMGAKYLSVTNPLKGVMTSGTLVYSDASETTTTIQGSVKKNSQQKQIDTDEYESILADLMNEAAAGTITEDEFRIEAESLVAAEIITAYLLASGKTIAQLTDEDRRIISEQTEVNLDAIPNLYIDSVAYGGDTETPTEELIDNRVTLWGVGLLAVYHLGLLYAENEDELLVWIVGPTDSCSTCSEQNGQIRTRREWRELANAGIYPQSKTGALECGGWRCQCAIVPA